MNRPLSTAASNDNVDHNSFFCALNKGFDLFTKWLMLFGDPLEPHTPKILVKLLFLPFAAAVFVLGWVLLNLGSK